MRHLTTLYDAIDDDVAFMRIAETVAAASGSRSANIHHFTPGGVTHFHQLSYYEPDQAKLYATSFVDKDVWLQVSQRQGRIGKILNMDKYLPAEEFIKTEYYNELFKPIGDDTARCMGSLNKVGSDMLVIAVHRPLGGSTYTVSEEAELGDIICHVRRVLRLRQLMAEERAQIHRLESMVDATEAAMLIVDQRMRILNGSAKAHRLLKAQDGLSARGTALEVSDRALAEQLACAVAAIVNRTRMERTGFLCERPSGLPAYRILVLPAGTHGDDGALILIDEPAAPGVTSTGVTWLGQVYRLTPAEQALASGLATGATLAEIADWRGVTRETLRTQLKSLFVKTKTGRQADLVRLLGTVDRPMLGNV